MVDRCNTCNGIYFDKGELEAILEIVRIFNTIKMNETEIDTTAAEKDRKLKCPEDGTIMDKREIGNQIIDICSACGGIWLDDKEIVALKIAENHIKNNINLYIRLGN